MLLLFTFFFLCPLYDIGVSQFENIIFFGVTIATNWVRKENACQNPSINPVFGRPLDLSETKLLICKTGQKMSTVYFFSIIMRTKKKKNVCETDVKTVNHSISVKDYCGS